MTSAGLRNNSQVLIYIDLDKALRAGIRFYLSANGVVLTKGDETGFLRPDYFQRVTDALGDPLPGWSGVVSEKRKSRSRSKERQAKSGSSSTEQVANAPNGDAEPDPTLLPTTEALSDLTLKEGR